MTIEAGSLKVERRKEDVAAAMTVGLNVEIKDAAD